MADSTKPAGLPDEPADHVLFGPPANERPAIVWPEPTPEDPDREVVVTEGATHVVIANRFAGWHRGDKIKEADLPEGADLRDLAKIKPYPPLRPFRDGERPKPSEVTKFDPKPKAVEPPPPPPVPPVDPPKPADKGKDAK